MSQTAAARRPVHRQGAERYRMDDYSESGGFGYAGNMWCDEKLVDPWKLAWLKPGKNACTTIRILPGIGYDDPNTFDPFRLPDGGFGDWMRCYLAWRSGGEPRTTFFLTEKPSREYDKAQNPAYLLYHAINTAVSRGQDEGGWAALLKGGQGRAALIVKPKPMYLVQCIMYEHGDKTYDPPRGAADNDRVVLMDLGSQAGRALQELFDKPAENPTSDDPLAAYEIGCDPIGIDPGSGLFCRFFPLAGGDPREQQSRAAAPRTTGFGGNRRREDRDDDTEIGFGVYAAPTIQAFSQFSPDYGDPGVQETLQKRIMPWEECLKFITEDEQAELLAHRIPRNILEYAWRDHPEWLASTAAAGRAMRNTTTHPSAEVPPETGSPARAASGFGRTRPQPPASQVPDNPPPEEEPVYEGELPQESAAAPPVATSPRAARPARAAAPSSGFGGQRRTTDASVPAGAVGAPAAPATAPAAAAAAPAAGGSSLDRLRAARAARRG